MPEHDLNGTQIKVELARLDERLKYVADRIDRAESAAERALKVLERLDLASASVGGRMMILGAVGGIIAAAAVSLLLHYIVTK